MSDEDRMILFQKVLGERKNDGWERNSFANIIPQALPKNPNIFLVEPKVVVEIEYESLGNEKRQQFSLSKNNRKNHK